MALSINCIALLNGIGLIYVHNSEDSSRYRLF